MPELSLLSALLVGLLGGGHCVGMCGGIVGAVSMTLPGQRPRLPFLLSYNLGRISSYALAGFLAGLLGASTVFVEHILPIERVLYGLANLMLILLGLYLAGVWHGLTWLEHLGSHVWRWLQPLGKRCLPVRSLPQAFAVGAVWGWLPCGLVYSVLVVAMASASPLQGMALMLAFGLGTLPALLGMGLAAARIKGWLQQTWLRRLSGGLILGFGLVGLSHLLR